MIEIKQIHADETYKLRHEILRPHQSLEDCKYLSDKEQSSFHLGAFIQNNLVGIASFSMEQHPSFLGDNQYRLRGMTTHPNFRKQHAGSSLIHHAKLILIERSAQFLWCNARTDVEEYYKRIGFKVHGSVFDIPSIGPHKLMYTTL
ncbi:GNAT family N-acetyltransferase [Bacillus manliponensis]|uniref:GNAT family N-acetyltransferase n=1 Tax=Bacillus manliponensis TaxID=574376 RepID=UPI0035119A85